MSFTPETIVVLPPMSEHVNDLPPLGDFSVNGFDVLFKARVTNQIKYFLAIELPIIKEDTYLFTSF